MHLVAEKGQPYPSGVRLPLCKRLSKVGDKLHVHLWRHWRLERVDDSFNYRRPFFGHRLADYRPDFTRLSYRVPPAPAALGKLGKVNRRELDSVLGVAKECHLLPPNHAKRIVLDYYHLDRQVVLHRSRKLGHEHGKAAVANERDALPVRVRYLRRYRVGQA